MLFEVRQLPDKFIYFSGTQNKFSSSFAEHVSFATFLAPRKVELNLISFLEFIPHLNLGLRKERGTFSLLQLMVRVLYYLLIAQFFSSPKLEFNISF
jgi:hypothetical protein